MVSDSIFRTAQNLLQTTDATSLDLQILEGRANQRSGLIQESTEDDDDYSVYGQPSVALEDLAATIDDACVGLDDEQKTDILNRLDAELNYDFPMEDFESALEQMVDQEWEPWNCDTKVNEATFMASYLANGLLYEARKEWSPADIARANNRSLGNLSRRKDALGRMARDELRRRRHAALSKKAYTPAKKNAREAFKRDVQRELEKHLQKAQAKRSKQPKPESGKARPKSAAASFKPHYELKYNFNMKPQEQEQPPKSPHEEPELSQHEMELRQLGKKNIARYKEITGDPFLRKLNKTRTEEFLQFQKEHQRGNISNDFYQKQLRNWQEKWKEWGFDIRDPLHEPTTAIPKAPEKTISQAANHPAAEVRVPKLSPSEKAELNKERTYEYRKMEWEHRKKWGKGGKIPFAKLFAWEDYWRGQGIEADHPLDPHVDRFHREVYGF